jgi:hypothetical protein
MFSAARAASSQRHRQASARERAQGLTESVPAFVAFAVRRVVGGVLLVLLLSTAGPIHVMLRAHAVSASGGVVHDRQRGSTQHAQLTEQNAKPYVLILHKNERLQNGWAELRPTECDATSFAGVAAR